MQNYNYTGDENITITAKDFLILKQAVEDGINNTVIVNFPEVLTPLNRETGELATEMDIKEGKSILVTDSQGTFGQENRKLSYDGLKLTAAMLEANRILLETHKKNIESGIAKPMTAAVSPNGHA